MCFVVFLQVSTSLSTTSFQREVHTQGNSGETPEHQRQSNLFPNCDSNKIVHSTTERSPVQTDSDGADPDLQDDLTGSSLNSFLKSDDISEDSLKTDSSNQSVTVQPEKATEKAKPLLHVNQVYIHIHLIVFFS